nr:MAG TPA: hypothetical protein [Caudoviricetes sp.]DAQ99337.1 MAG TPA: hypothetical protein [Caudoviricetes sp.]
MNKWRHLFTARFFGFIKKVNKKVISTLWKL